MRSCILIFSIFVFSHSLMAKDFCSIYLGATEAQDLGDTDKFISYLTRIYDEKIIDLLRLQNFVNELERNNQLINPIAHQQVSGHVLFSRSTDEVHYKLVQEFIDHSTIDKSKLLRWGKDFSKKQQEQHARKDSAKNDTFIARVKMQFHRIKPGKFLTGVDSAMKEAELTHPFEVMSTEVTQWMWVEIMGDNPSHFKDGKDSVVISVKGKEVRLQPDHPVENIDFASMVEFANRMSRLHGFKEAYILKGKNYEVNAPDGDIYQTEGYRLATQAEFQYLLRNAGQSSERYFPGLNDKNFSQYAWTQENADKQTHSVATRLPLIIQGYEFYDLLGNVLELNHDFVSETPVFGVNPQVPDGTGYGTRSARGGDWGHNIEALATYFYFGNPEDGKGDNLGFRLVRTLK